MSNNMNPYFVFVVCAIVAWFAWPTIKQYFDGGPRGYGYDYDERGYMGGGGRGGDYGGRRSVDRNEGYGGRGGYSDFYPGRR